MTSPEQNTHNSTLREQIVEHLFVGEALRAFWCKGVTDVEVFRPEFDAHGYDLAMARKSVVRHIQFKTGIRKPSSVTVATSLAGKPSGCVIWIIVDADLKLGPFYWLGDRPGRPLPSISNYPNAKRVTWNKLGERPVRQNHREVPIGLFERLDDFSVVLGRLFDD